MKVSEKYILFYFWKRKHWWGQHQSKPVFVCIILTSKLSHTKFHLCKRFVRLLIALPVAKSLALLGLNEQPRDVVHRNSRWFDLIVAFSPFQWGYLLRLVSNSPQHVFICITRSLVCKQGLAWKVYLVSLLWYVLFSFQGLYLTILPFWDCSEVFAAHDLILTSNSNVLLDVALILRTGC